MRTIGSEVRVYAARSREAAHHDAVEVGSAAQTVYDRDLEARVTRKRSTWWGRLTLSVVIALAACGGSSEYTGSSESSGGYAVAAESTGGESYDFQAAGASAEARNAQANAAPAPPMDSPMSDSVSIASDESDSDDADSGRSRYAQNTPPPQAAPAGQALGPTPRNAADDAQRGPLLIYQATLHLSVFEVEATQGTVTEIARELGGFLARQNDQQVVIRVPAGKFREALARIEQAGDVLHRNIEALDVSEEFRDVQIRLRNAEVVRDRLAALMAQARTVEEALAVQVELERITGVIEQLKGRMQYLGDRIAFSTITVFFQPAANAGTDQPDVFRLPFPWLDELSLRSLLNLPYQD